MFDKIAKFEGSKEMPEKCSKCQTEIEQVEGYRHDLDVLCEDCCLDTRTIRIRKTHWQYLRSKKTEYLINGKKE